MLSPYKLTMAAFLLATPGQARIPLSSMPPLGSVASRHSSVHLPSPSGLFGVLQVRGGNFSDDETESEDVDDDDTGIEDVSDDESSDEKVQDDDSDADDGETQHEEAVEPSSTGPVKLVIKTNLNCPISDQTLEFTASGKRTVESLKQAISKTMRGRPPLQTIILKHSGRTLSDDETVSSVLLDVDSDDEDSDVEGNIGEEDFDTVKLTLDTLPPIDQKFGTELKEKAEKLSTKELLQAYCLNVAGLRLGMELGQKEMEEYDELIRSDVDGTGGEDHDPLEEGVQNDTTNQSLHIRKQAALLHRQMEKLFGDETLQLMEEEHERVRASMAEGDDPTSTSEVVYGLVPSAELSQRNRKGRAIKGGATMNIKRALQRNMNVNWADTTRNSLLFLFFGYFGGRNSFSRTFLLLSAPLCFFIQTRPVKVAIKQAFYAIGKPPGILLSLLPAPQQAIMSLNYASAMKELYGDDVITGESWYEDIIAESDADDYDDEYDSYDD